MRPASFPVVTVLMLAAVAAASFNSAAQAQSPPPTPTQILEALKQRGGTRGVSTAAQPADLEQRKLLESLLLKLKTRGLSEPELDQLGPLVDKQPNIDLTIFFDFDSASITAKAMPTVIALGQAISNAEVGTVKFLLGGHTDAKGTTGYNQALSERRAQAVRKFLIDNFKVPESRLSVVGFGKQRLKNAANPLADENRRVQVVNVGETR